MKYRAAISWSLIIILLFINLQSVFALSLKNEKISYSDINARMRKIRYWTEQLRKVEPKQGNLGKVYQFASDAMLVTGEAELFYLDSPHYKSGQRNLIQLARFWKQIDRVIGDVDNNADEVYATYLMLYPNGRYYFEANNWVNRKK